MTQDLQTPKESPSAYTSKVIAFILIGIYGTALIIIGVVAALKPSPEDQAWIELFKSGFLILGGGLTTVVGYYFGSRGVQEAQTTAEEARREADNAKKEKGLETTKRQELEASMMPTYDETSLIEPDEMPDSG